MPLDTKFHDGAQRLLRLLFPPRCVGCDGYLEAEALTCRRCEHAVFEISGPICLVCGQPRPSVAGGYAGVDDICGPCLQTRPAFDRARAKWEYAGTIAEALQRAKYRGELWALRDLATALRPWLTAQIEEAETEYNADASTVLTAVPMHPSDLRRRGYNGALLLGRLALPRRHMSANLVRKTRKTPAQAGLARGQRMTNLRNAFECIRPDRICGNRIVLFDDVMTTGATTSEVAKVLDGAGASEVIVLTAARTIAN